MGTILSTSSNSKVKSELYETLIKDIDALMVGEDDSICIMANAAAAIHAAFGFFWTGFYRVVGDFLVLGPFQGPVACCRIAYGRGVCGTAWKERRSIVVPDVNAFPGHIACSGSSKSEIVVPILVCGEVAAVVDIDSDALATFDDCDCRYLEKIANLISFKISGAVDKG